jgi:hypothetical protein
VPPAPPPAAGLGGTIAVELEVVEGDEIVLDERQGREPVPWGEKPSQKWTTARPGK